MVMKKYSVLKPHIKKVHGVWMVTNFTENFETYWGGKQRLEKAVDWCRAKNKTELGI